MICDVCSVGSLKPVYFKKFLRGLKPVKEEMYNTMNSYYNYTSILKSYFSKIKINAFYLFVTTSHYESNFP